MEEKTDKDLEYSCVRASLNLPLSSLRSSQQWTWEVSIANVCRGHHLHAPWREEHCVDE